MQLDGKKTEKQLPLPNSPGYVPVEAREQMEVMPMSPGQLGNSVSSAGDKQIGVLNRTTSDSKAPYLNNKMSFGSSHQPFPHLSNQSPLNENERITEEDEEGFDQEDKEFFNKYF